MHGRRRAGRRKHLKAWMACGPTSDYYASRHAIKPTRLANQPSALAALAVVLQEGGSLVLAGLVGAVQRSEAPVLVEGGGDSGA